VAAAARDTDADIAQLADRLARHNQADGGFSRPSRNLFRFVPRPVRQSALPSEPIVAALPVAPPQPVIRLSGVAMDRVEGQDVWTAILSTPAGVVLARAGEQVIPGWTVSVIEPERVSLTRPDGSILDVPLSGR
jgi:hypothetical protein